jgi:hypothetical protein
LDSEVAVPAVGETTVEDVFLHELGLQEVGLSIRLLDASNLPANSCGIKILNGRPRKVVNRATVAFRHAALTLLRSQSYLGAQYRRLRTRLGAPQAITAMARKLACLFYWLIKHGQPYVDKGSEYYEARYREQQIRSLSKRAQKLGLELVIPKIA